MLNISNLHVSVDNKEILKGISLQLEKGKIYALMGPNGSGKSTLAQTIMGHPNHITNGNITLDDKDITSLPADERAKLGLFLSFQYPKAVKGVTISNFLRTAWHSRNLEGNFEEKLQEVMMLLGIPESFVGRYLNEGFSGGEKKKAEILQLLVLNPDVAILDETDSGLDIDALKVVASGVNTFMSEEKTVLIITHYKRILEYITPDKVFIMKEGKIVQEGEKELVDHLEEKGYTWLK